MLKIALSGCNGRMGRVTTEICAEREQTIIVAGFDRNTEKRADYPVYADPFEFTGACDVLIDFSNADALSQLLKYCRKTKTPLVACTTGYSEEQVTQIEQAAQEIPILRSGNMSLGINLMMDLLRRCAQVLGDKYDVEIIEKHHNQKLDAPSGTALMLADAVSQALPYEAHYVYDRHERRAKRDPHEIGLHAVRGGTIVGEHEAIFAGRNETIEIRHVAQSRDLFASGALEAAGFLASCKEPGLYNMSHVIAAR